MVIAAALFTHLLPTAPHCPVPLSVPSQNWNAPHQCSTRKNLKKVQKSHKMAMAHRSHSGNVRNFCGFEETKSVVQPRSENFWNCEPKQFGSAARRNFLNCEQKHCTLFSRAAKILKF
jgi:hypothetical protein